MHIVCVCSHSVDVEVVDFGISYVTCKNCGREYEINTEFELAIDVDEEDCALIQQALQPDNCE